VEEQKEYHSAKNPKSTFKYLIFINNFRLLHWEKGGGAQEDIKKFLKLQRGYSAPRNSIF
jgi:hypothetical protein